MALFENRRDAASLELAGSCSFIVRPCAAEFKKPRHFVRNVLGQPARGEEGNQ